MFEFRPKGIKKIRKDVINKLFWKCKNRAQVHEVKNICCKESGCINKKKCKSCIFAVKNATEKTHAAFVKWVGIVEKEDSDGGK